MIGGIAMVSEQIFIWLSQIIFVAFVCDYCGCKKYFPVLYQKNWFIRILLYVVLEFLLLFIAACLCVIKDMLIA